MDTRYNRVVATWLALLLFGIYLLTYSGQIFSGDGMSMFSVTESFVKRGELNTDQLWTLFKSRNEIAVDGESYAKYGYGTSLLAAPLYVLALALPAIGLVQTTILASAVAIAGAGALVFLAARRLNFSRGVGVIAGLLFGLATPAFVYAREFWSEPFGLVALFTAFYFLLCYRDEMHDRDALIAGVAFALAVAIRVTNVALVPVFVWYAFSTNLPSLRRPGRSVIAFLLPLAIVAVSVAWYNGMRFGNILATGYRADETFDNPILLGLYGLLFSPGKGLFVYVPFLAALPFSFAVFYRRAKREAISIFAIFVFYVLLFSAWYYWWGGTSWGPRFLVPTLPFLVLAIAPAIEIALNSELRSKAQAAFAAVFFALCALSVAIELLGVSIPALAYRVRMVRLSSNAEMDAVFQPQFSPLVGYFDLLKPSALNFAWLRSAGGAVTMDWLVVALIVIFTSLCVWLLAVDSRRSAVIGSMVLFAIALSIFSFYRYADDPRLGGGAGYPALVQTLQRDAQPGDVMILNDDARTPYFLNANRATPRWYGLSRDPKQFDDATRALLLRLSKNYSRVWLAFDDANTQLPNPMKDWLDENLRARAQHDFDDGAHLILYATDARR